MDNRDNGVRRRSPPTARVLHVLELFASDPAVPFSAGRVAKQLEITPATCLGILNELTHRGYLQRDPETRTYTIGIALLPLGQAAVQSRPWLRQVGHWLRSLSAEVGYDLSAAATLQDQAVIFDVAVNGRHGGSFPIRPGMRFPFRAPLALMHAVWEPDHVVEAWQARAAFTLSEQRLHRIWEVIRSGREAGYLVRRLTETEMSLTLLLAESMTSEDQEHFGHVLLQASDIVGEAELTADELRTNPQSRISTVTVPVMTADGTPELLLTARIDRELPLKETLRTAERLQRAADELSSATRRLSSKEADESPQTSKDAH